MERMTYPDVMALIDQWLQARDAEIRGGRTTELRAVTDQARAKVEQTIYRLTDRPQRPAEPDDDPLLPKRRGKP